MKDNTKEKASGRPTMEELLKFGVFYKNDNIGNPIYRYYDSFYGIVGDKISKVRMKGISGL